MTKNREPIYDINNASFLEEDIEIILDELSNLYEVTFKQESIEIMPKTKVQGEVSLFANTNTIVFNRLVPKLKSLTKDMYAIIEGIYKAKRGEFKKLELESKYHHLKELRIFNNKLKHHNNREAEINLTQLVMNSGNENLIDCYINFSYLKSGTYEVLRFTDLIVVFFTILEDEDLIKINRS